jgi:hypothetical protein
MGVWSSPFFLKKNLLAKTKCQIKKLENLQK